MAFTIGPEFLDPPVDPNVDPTMPVDPGREITAGPGNDPGFTTDPTQNTAVVAGDGSGTRTAGLPGSTADGALLDQFPQAGFATGTVNPGTTSAPSEAPPGPLSGPWTDLRGQTISGVSDPARTAVVSGFPAAGAPPPGSAQTTGNPATDHFITRLGVESAPGVAGLPGGPATVDTGAPGSFQQEFEKKFGFYNPEFNSQANMEHNLLMGDSVIRPQAEYMAQFDPNLKAELNTINGLPDFYNSENAATWDAAHNQQLTGRVANNELTLGQAQGQSVAVPAHPIDNAHALMTKTLQDTLVKNLADLGATNFTQTFDNAGNPTLAYTAANGTQQSVTSTLVDYANAIDQLRKNIAAAPPRGGGGGYAPPQAPTGNTTGYTPPPAGAEAFAYGSSGGFPAIAAPGTFNNHGQQQNPLLLGPNIPNAQPY